ncbi:hypothetical protein [Halopseudomonas maritima]|uniref:hypothetical protein n=1 Tax=Halopseudomonas maritima TaxID=2918528 RepID=UPI001EECD5F8|nr:hypothetical protein [Halopseudomonas maritima]UJJ32391.1 hypothetical protein HV822_04275 [Halopseudomonas maritima]
MTRFEVVFQGQVQAGAAPEQVRANVGKLFQVSGSQLDALFSGRRIVIKQGLDQVAAEKYRIALERAGAQCSIVPMDGPAADVPPAAPAQPEPAAQPAPAAERPPASSPLVPRDEFMAAFSDVEAPDLDIAPLGADMQDEYDAFTPLPIDLSALSLAPVGSDMGELKKDDTAQVPNTDHLKLSEE